MGLIEAMFGNYSKKELKRIEPIKQQVLDLEPKYQAMSDAELRKQTDIFKDRLEELDTVDSILPEALAVCREAAYRVLGKKPYPVQIIGAIVLHQGRIAEMKTGEGKTLVACLASYANALAGKGVHVVTVNDYLAKFQSEEMGKVYRFLGLSIGVVLAGMTNEQKKAANARHSVTRPVNAAIVIIVAKINSEESISSSPYTQHSTEKSSSLMISSFTSFAAISCDNFSRHIISFFLSLHFFLAVINTFSMIGSIIRLCGILNGYNSL